MQRGSLSKAVVAVLLAVPMVASAALRDVGPVNAGTGFPEWYRDTNMTPVSLCTDQRPSPNASAGGAPLCFPIVPDPAGYAGNLGGEIFYYNASATLTGAAGFSMLWEGALEATYATGVPIRGDEITFTRIRVVMDTNVAGTYTVTHPFGKETFTNVPKAKRGVFFTVDIGVSPGIFTGALAGSVGPFLQWDTNPLDPAAPYGIDPASGLPYSLRLANPDGTFSDFLGDPNFAHTVTGSPFGTNYVRVDGPPGSNLDGLGNDFIVTNLFTVLGQVYMNPIPTPMEICRATYGVDGATGVTQVDVFAEGGLGSQLVATAPGVPTLALFQDGTGYAVGHAEFLPPPGSALPPTMTVTNLTDNPHSKITAPLTDVIQLSPAVFFTDATGATAGVVSITAETSVHTLTPPTLSVVELPGIVGVPADPATPWIQTFSATIPVGTVPPWDLTVVSQAGGSRVEKVIFNPTGVLVPVGPPALPYAAPQSLSTGTGVAVSFSAVDPAFAAATITVLNPPASGTAVVNAAGTITYTPKPLFTGLDAFTYILSVPDPVTGKPVYSNAGQVDVNVAFINSAPTATNDVATTASGAPVTINVAANDVDLDGTVVATSVAIATPPLALAGTAVNNGNGTITFTPAAGFVGSVTFTYTIADNLGAVSAPGTVTVTVFSNTEVLTITSAIDVVSKARWKVTGTSSIFGPGLANVVTVYIGRPPALGSIVGKATIDPTGAWAIDVINSAIKLDATNSVTAISTGGGTASALVQLK